MWILSFLPFWIFYVILFIGILAFFSTYLIKFIPIGFIYVYRVPIQIASLLLIVFGTYVSGAISNEKAWLFKVKEMEVKIAEAEAKSAKENVKIVERVINNKQVIRERGEEIVKYVDREIVKYDDKCEVPKEVVSVLNQAAEGIK